MAIQVLAVLIVDTFGFFVHWIFLHWIVETSFQPRWMHHLLLFDGILNVVVAALAVAGICHCCEKDDRKMLQVSGRAKHDTSPNIFGCPFLSLHHNHLSPTPAEDLFGS